MPMILVLLDQCLTLMLYLVRQSIHLVILLYRSVPFVRTEVKAL